MPNHVGNRLYVRGDAEQLQEFGIEAMGHDGRKNEALDIENFVPLPKELEGICSGFTTIDGIKYEKWREIKKADGTTDNVGITKEEENRLTKKYGAASEYDWRSSILGTKWGTYESSLEKTKDGEVAYDFQTAWSPFSAEVLMLMSKKYPTLEFEYKFAEQGGGFYGKYEAKAGVIIDEEEYDTKGKYDEKEEDWDESKFDDQDYPNLLRRSG